MNNFENETNDSYLNFKVFSFLKQCPSSRIYIKTWNNSKWLLSQGLH